MSRRPRTAPRALLPACLAAGAYAIALLQRPGQLAADTKIDLHTDPAAFLGDVASVWSASGGLGQVQAGQYAGYLFPMGPFFAVGDLLGLAPWLVHRLWLGTLLALAAWGTVRLLDALLDGPRGAAHVVAGAGVVLNPYVVVFSNRTSVTLLGYVALPWLLLCVHRGLRDSRRWLWPAAFALVLAASGGGVNAAVTAWLMLGPLLLLGYELAFGGVDRRAALRLTARTALLAVLASLWWIVPVVEHARYGLNFLPFTESPGAIWDTTSMGEGFRLLGYWIGYLGTGYGERLVPYFDTAGTLLFDPLVVLATFAVPALAVAGFAWTRRWAYGPFFLALVLLGLLVMGAGFPEGAPLRRALTFTYNGVDAVQFMRTTYKAGPLVALGLVCLLGGGAAVLWSRLKGRRTIQALAVAAFAVALAGAAWPLVQGTAVDRQIAFEEVPEAWQLAASDLDEELPANTRALVLPGQLFPFYEWGGTQDPILPALSERPVTVRGVVPFADLHAADLLVATDALVQQRRLYPGQLPPLLDLMGIGAVVTGTDDDRDRSGSVAPAAAAEMLAAQPGLEEPDRSYGPLRAFSQPSTDLSRVQRLPQVRRYDTDSQRGLVRVAPLGPETVVDGSAEGLLALAALGSLPARRPLAYAGDRDPGELREAAAGGAQIVITDSNRRRAFLSSRVNQSNGFVLGPDDRPPKDSAFLNPFPDRGTDAQTVALLDGARYLDAPYSPNFPQFPEHRPYAAFDGERSTYWVADRYLDRSRRWIEIGFERPLDVPYVDLLPQRETATDVVEVEIAGRRHRVTPGWNRLPVDLRGVSSLRVRITELRGPRDRFRGPGSIAELGVPGLRVRERLRPPRLAELALRGESLERASLAYVFTRNTGDDPFRRSRRPDPDRGLVPKGRNQEAALTAEPGDPEELIKRWVQPPIARRFAAEGLVTVAPGAPDDLIDRLAGYEGQGRFTSSGRFEGLPARRASSAFDGDRSTAWIGQGTAGSPPWIAWRLPRAIKVDSILLISSPQKVGVPTEVRVRWGGGATGRLKVSATGRVDLPRTLRTKSLRIEVVAARRPAGGAGVPREAVGISDVRVAGLEPVAMPRSGALRAACGAVEVRTSEGRLSMRPTGSVADLDSGRPLAARPCGRLAELGTGRATVEVERGPFRVDVLRLDSPAPTPDLGLDRGGGRVLDSGKPGRGSYEGVKLALDGPSWLVLGESFNGGWRASCDGDALGAPEVVDGYANGWRVPASCRDVDFGFAPNRAAHLSYWISGLACLAMLLVILAEALRRRGREGIPLRAQAPRREAAGRWPLRRALVVGVALALPAAFLFSLRAGAVIGPLVALLLWRGAGARSLALTAGVLLGVAAPAVQLALLPDDLGGFNSEYPLDLIVVHWLAVGAWVLLALALWRSLAGGRSVSRASRPSGGRAAAPGGEASSRARP